MIAYKSIIYDITNKLRLQNNLGNYCGRSLFDVIEKIDIDGSNPLLFRLPFKNIDLAGFVGYKNDRFSVFLNSNRTLGYEIFTAAHEIYHLIENTSGIKEDIIIEENDTSKKENCEVLADSFAVELLIPEMDISREYERLIKLNALKSPDESTIIILQQQYFVEYRAITKRLAELNIIDCKIEKTLNEIMEKENELSSLTKKLGYSNQLNEPSENVMLPREFLKAIEENYKNKDTSFDDLIVLFSYCDLEPKEFGYEEEELTESAKAFMEKIKLQLGSENIGKK